MSLEFVTEGKIPIFAPLIRFEECAVAKVPADEAEETRFIPKFYWAYVPVKLTNSLFL